MVLVPVVVGVGAVWGLVASVSAVLRRAWSAPATWVRFAVLAASAALLGYGYGLLRMGGLDQEETCVHLRHQRYDEDFVREHHAEQLRWFPLHSYCNADYDLVPAWVNPSVALLALAAVGAAAVAVTLAVRSRGAGAPSRPRDRVTRGPAGRRPSPAWPGRRPRRPARITGLRAGGRPGSSRPPDGTTSPGAPPSRRET